MKNLSTLLLLTTSITTSFAMEAAPGGVAGGAASRVATDVAHAEPAAPAPISNNQNMVLTPHTMGVFRTIAEHLGTKDLLNFSMAQRNHTVPCLKIIKSRLEGMGLPVDLIEEVPPQMLLVPHLAISDLRILESIYGMDAPTRLQTYITLGNIFKALQAPIAEGLAKGKYGIVEDHSELRRLAYAGWVETQKFLAQGLMFGQNGIKKNHTELWRLAYEERWDWAQLYVAGILAFAEDDVERKQTELRRLAYEERWPSAQKIVAKGLAYAKDDVERNQTELRRLADEGWLGAQIFIVEALGKIRGLPKYKEDEMRRKNYIERARLAQKGWVPAIKSMAHVLAWGNANILKDRAELRRLAIQHINEPDSPYVRSYLGTLPSLRKMIQFLVDPTRAE